MKERDEGKGYTHQIPLPPQDPIDAKHDALVVELVHPLWEHQAAGEGLFFAGRCRGGPQAEL
jgi:hypothetical protein